MPAQLNIQDGPATAPWASDAIRIRQTRATSLTTVGPHTEPNSGQEYYTYVQVNNKCACATTGPWAIRSNFIDTNPPTSGPNGMTVTIASGFATLTQGATQVSQWLHATGDFWSWSPGGTFFAYVHRDLSLAASPTWTVNLIATAAYTKAPPAVGASPIAVPAKTSIATVGPTLSASLQAISGINLGWNPAGTCLHIDQPPLPYQNPMQKDHLWICPYAGNSTTAGTYSFTSIIGSTGQPTGYSFLYSPCGGMVAIVPTPTGQLTLIDLTTATITQAKVSNVPTTVTINGSSPTITSAAIGAKGITLTQMSPTAIDNADCLRGGSVLVDAQRVLITTQTSMMTTVAVGSGPSAAAIWPNQPIWVEIPKHLFTRMGAVSPEHWCMQVRGDGSANGDPAPPMSQFNIPDRHFAQRNIFIL